MNQKSDEGKNEYREVNNSLKRNQQQASESVKVSEKKSQMIIKECLKQNSDFKRWYAKKLWKTFHSSHYDWWAFPIDQFSSQGDTYKVSEKEITTMKQSKYFMQALQSNAKMVCQAWGYDLLKGELIKTQNVDQKWHNWPIRLYKMTKSLEIFGVENLFKNCVKYGCILIKDGKNFTYSKRELSKYYLEKYDILFKGKNNDLKQQLNQQYKPTQSTKKSIKIKTNTKNLKDKSKI